MIDGVIFDISKRMKLQERLSLSLQTSLDIVRSIPSGLIVYQYEPPDRLILIKGNNAADKFVNFSLDEHIGREFNEIWPLAKKKGMTDALLRVIKTGKDWRNEDFQYKDDRVEGAFSITAFRMRGKRLGVAFENITKRKRASEALLDSEKRFRGLVESSTDWIWEVDENGVYTYASPKVFDLIGYLPEEVVGKTPFDFMTEDEAERVRAIFEEVLKGKKSFEALENINIHKDGRRVVLETNGVMVFDAQGNI